MFYEFIKLYLKLHFKGFHSVIFLTAKFLYTNNKTSRYVQNKRINLHRSLQTFLAVHAASQRSLNMAAFVLSNYAKDWENPIGVGCGKGRAVCNLRQTEYDKQRQSRCSLVCGLKRAKINCTFSRSITDTNCDCFNVYRANRLPIADCRLPITDVRPVDCDCPLITARPNWILSMNRAPKKIEESTN